MTPYRAGIRVDLPTDVVASPIPLHQAAERVRLAVEQLPGAFWISVEWCGRRWFIAAAAAGIMEGRRWDAIKVDNKAKVAAGWGSVRDLALAKFPAAGVGLRIDATQLPKGVERLAPLAGSMN